MCIRDSWETKDGLIINLSLAADTTTKNLWAAISVTIRNNASEKVKKEAANIQARTEGWEFLLGEATIKKLQSTVNTLTKVKNNN